ncbi:hypothetical protein J8Z82_10305 [Yersinia enterocolitica]|uniref:hypothetical protein n=1 Tax=Yersinia enterocolitica TaxID=630 RepID=UPI001C8E6BE8|nr:hypothetical protein [Yersinia enterocolitica]MBX9485981.1 hypothetical protein [Yersinia enterocolitica]MBX9492178.1 hypothetical protein [Yersinia enterocolitica]
MNTQNVNIKTATPKSSERYGEGQNNHAKTRGVLRQALEDAIGEVAMAEEAHAHYGEPFGFKDVIHYWISGFFSSFKKQ